MFIAIYPSIGEKRGGVKAPKQSQGLKVNPRSQNKAIRTESFWRINVPHPVWHKKTNCLIIEIMLRPSPIIQGEYYHILGRGNNKENIFINDRDYIRFLFLILYFQSPTSFENISRIVDAYIKQGRFAINPDTVNEILRKRFVNLIGFALMPNHYHLIVYERKAGGISRYMQRILNSSTKYFNLKYERVGHLFQGPYKSVHVEDNDQLLHLSSYLHLNPKDLNKWRSKEIEYPWSSFQDYAHKNRWGRLLATDIIMNQFDDGKEYEEFTLTSGAKNLLDEIEEDSKIF